MKRVLATSTESVTRASPNTGRKTTCRPRPTVPRKASGPVAAITHTPPSNASRRGYQHSCWSLHPSQAQHRQDGQQARQRQPQQPLGRDRRVERKEVADAAARKQQSARHQQRQECLPTHPSTRHRPRAQSNV